jgi:S-adenosylmethionine hydrolase
LPVDLSKQKNTLNFANVFAKAYQKILEGNPLEQCGDPDISIEVKNPLRPLRGEKYIEGQIIFIDNFENVIINITKEEFEEQRRGRSFKIVFKRDEIIDKISETYADVHESEKLALFNSANYLEIAINKGNAAGLFGLEGYTEKVNMQTQYMQNRLLYQTVKIYFD